MTYAYGQIIYSHGYRQYQGMAEWKAQKIMSATNSLFNFLFVREGYLIVKIRATFKKEHRELP